MNSWVGFALEYGELTEKSSRLPLTASSRCIFPKITSEIALDLHSYDPVAGLSAQRRGPVPDGDRRRRHAAAPRRVMTARCLHWS
jgi:hypothetical protein